MVPPRGLEPLAFGLQNRRSSWWAIVALSLPEGTSYFLLPKVPSINAGCMAVRWHTVERIELPTRGFGDPCSTTELHRHKRKAKLPYILSYYLKIMFTLSEGLLIFIMFTSFTIIYSIIFLRYTIYNLSSREKVSKINKLFFWHFLCFSQNPYFVDFS